MIASSPQLLHSSVFHRRFRPRENSFRYKLFYVAWRLSDTQKLTRRGLFRVNAPGLFSFYDKDHGLRDGSSAGQWILGLFASHGIEVSSSDVLVITMPRVLGYVFNPVSFWFALDSQTQSIRAVIAEVNNTFSEHHWYLCLPPEGRTALDGEWISGDKVFHVSPFLAREGSYRFRFSLREKHYGIVIDHVSPGGETLLQTAVSGEARPLSSRALIEAFFRFPLLTLRVVWLIHWQALKLLLKGATYFSKPEPLEPALTVAAHASDKAGIPGSAAQSIDGAEPRGEGSSLWGNVKRRISAMGRKKSGVD